MSVHRGIREGVLETNLLFGGGVGSSRGKGLRRRGWRLGQDSEFGLEVGGRPPRARPGVTGVVPGAFLSLDLGGTAGGLALAQGSALLLIPATLCWSPPPPHSG